MITTALYNQLVLKFIPTAPSVNTVFLSIAWRNYYQSIEIVYTTVYSHHPIIRAYFLLIFGRNHYQSIFPSSDPSIHIILSPYDNILKQLLSTPSEEPIKQIIPSPHQQSLLKFIFHHPISRDNKSDYPVTQSDSLSPHHQIQEIRLSCHPISRTKKLDYPVTPSVYPIVPFIVQRNYFQSIHTVDTTVYSCHHIIRAYFSIYCLDKSLSFNSIF